MNETLEEAAEKYAQELLKAKTILYHEKTWIKAIFIWVAKWQVERIENEYKQLINELELLAKDNNLGERYRAGITASIWRMKELFKQFKKNKL